MRIHLPHGFYLTCLRDSVPVKKLEDNNILYVTMPNNCTDRLQPLDLSVNKPAKDFLQSKFQPGTYCCVYNRQKYVFSAYTLTYTWTACY